MTRVIGIVIGCFFFLATTSYKLTNMAVANVKLADIPLYFSLNVWLKHLSL